MKSKSIPQHTSYPATRRPARSLRRSCRRPNALLPVWLALGGVVALGHPSTAGAQAAAAAADSKPWQKPAWLTDLSLGVKESYDDNVYISGVDQSLVPAGTKTQKDHTSLITTFSPKIGVSVTPLVSAKGPLQALSLAYAPDFVLFSDHSTESYDAHRLIGAMKGKVGDFSYSVDDSFFFVHGSEQGPTYPGGLLNAWSTIMLKDRREQLQDRGKITLQYDWNNWFVRPTAALIYWDMETALKNPALGTTPSGYQNYEDRNDVNGGADVGYKIMPQIAVTAGYRYGHQYQQLFPWDPHTSSSDYQRALAGIEGQPWKWLKVALQGGPDFRSYTSAAPVNSLHPVTYYGEALVAATVTTNDTVTFKYKQWEFVSACGRVPYFDSSYDLSLVHKFSKQWSVDLGGKIVGADYTSGNLGATSLRNDYDYIVAAGVHFVLNSHVGCDLTYGGDFGRNAQDNIVNSSTRDFQRQVVSLGASLKF